MKTLALLIAPAVAAAQTASFQGIGDVGGKPFESSAHAVSADGLVVVGSSIGSSNRVPVRWTTLTGLESIEPEPPGLRDWTAAAASADGSVIVGSSDGTGGSRAFRWTLATGMLDLGDLPGGAVSASATGVSGDGSIVVGSSDDGSFPTYPHEAFRWTAAGGMQPMFSLSVFSWARGISLDGTTIVGNLGGSAYRWTAGGMQSLGVEDKHPIATSSDGTIVVGKTQYYPPYFVGCGAVRWTPGASQPECLATGSPDSLAAAVSGDGSVIVGMDNAAAPQAFIWDAPHGARMLRQVLQADYGLDLTGWQLSAANGISADGTVIVGTGVNPCGQTEGWVARLGPRACPPDCDGDGTLNLADFGCFQTRFALADPYADCNGDCARNFADFGCFQTKFALGCP